MKTHSKFYQSAWFYLGIILLIAAFLRLYRIDVLMRFIWDEGRDMLAMRNIIVNRDLTLFGPFNEIAGHKDFFGVFHYYLMLPALYFANFDPTGPAIFTALLGVAAIALSYCWLKNFLSRSNALLICAVLAFSPLAVRFNQWAWNPNTVGFFAILYLLALQKFQSQNTKAAKIFWIALAGFFLGLLFQLHYFTVALVAPVLFMLLPQYKKTWQEILIFGFGFILPNLTFLIFDITHAGFYRQIIWESFVGNNHQKFFTFSFKNLIFGPFTYLFDTTSKLLGSKFLGLGLTITWLIYAWQKLKNFKINSKNSIKINEEIQLILAWIFFLLLTSFFPALLNDYHSAVLWPSLAIALVITLQKKSLNKYLYLMIALFIWLIYANHFWRQPNWQENMPRLRTAALTIAKDAKTQTTSNINLASFVDPETRGIRFRYFVINAGQKLLGFDDYPRSEILYAITPHSWQETQQNPAWELDTFREATATAIWSDGEWTVFRVSKF
jgi:hypothetical protein